MNANVKQRVKNEKIKSLSENASENRPLDRHRRMEIQAERQRQTE